MTTYDDLLEMQEQAILEEWLKEHEVSFAELAYD